MATKKPLKQKTIENPSVAYLRPEKEKALARLHRVLKTLDANGNDDDVFNASKIKASPRPGKSAAPSTDKNNYGPTINNYDSLYAALGKNRQDNPSQDYATDEETELDEKLAKNASTKEIINDFIESDAPQFQGKSKAKRIQMAVATSYKNEEAIDEVSKRTLKSYVSKANKQVKGQDWDLTNKDLRRYKNRSTGLQRAAERGVKALPSGDPKKLATRRGIHEGRKAMPLHGHENHYKSDDELRYIAKDAHAAAENFKGSGMRVPGSHIEAENKYRDQMHDALTVLHHRSKGGKRLERPKTNEEVLHELSKKVLRSYTSKAHDDVIVRRFSGGSRDKANKRVNYIQKADKKVIEANQLDELSKEKLTSYAAKASASHTDAVLSKDKRKLANRTIGLGKAKALIRSEEAKPKSLEEVSKDLLTRYAAKASASHTDAVLSKDKRKLANRTIGLGKAKALVRSDEEIEEAAFAHKGPKRRSASAASLRLPQYRKKVIPSGKLYNRKKAVNEAIRLPKGITSPGEIRKYLATIARQNKEKVTQVAKALKKAEHSKHKQKTTHYDYHDGDRGAK